MSALDNARAVLAEWSLPAIGPTAAFSDALAALVAECESERAQLGELLLRTVEVCDARDLALWLRPAPGNAGGWAAEVDARFPNMDVWDGEGPTLADALIALLAKVEGGA